MPNTSGQSMPFVKRFEMAVMQYVILHKAKQGEVTRDNLASTFKGNMQMSSDHLDHCLNELVQDGHLKEVGGNKYSATDDGREDVQKLQTLVMELGSLVGGNGGGQSQKQGGMAQQKTTGGTSGTGGGSSGGMGGSGGSSGGGSSGGNMGGNTTSGSTGGGSTTGSTVGNAANTGSSTKSGR